MHSRETKVQLCWFLIEKKFIKKERYAVGDVIKSFTSLCLTAYVLEIISSCNGTKKSMLEIQ